MILCGIQKTSLVNYPGSISSVLFTGGCNLRCSYCYNRSLVENESQLQSEILSEDDVLSTLEQRKNFIDGVVITGGEPAIHADIAVFIQRLRETVPVRVKLDTNGFFPEVIEDLLRKKLLDFIAIDIKTSPEKYETLVNTSVNLSQLKNTLETVKKSNISYELRSTVVPGFFDDDDIKSISSFTGKVENYHIQQYINELTLDTSFQEIYPYSKEDLSRIRERILSFSTNCSIRGL